MVNGWGMMHLLYTSMGPTICHGLGLSSVYQHVLPGLGQPEVTTLHSEAGATVDYIFYTPRRDPPSGDPKGALPCEL